MATVILGGGIIGLSTAYYLSLSRPPSDAANPAIHIVDSSSELLASASGYAGGFLVLDWFARPSASLGALSFRLHRELAAEHDGQQRWGYAGSHVYSLAFNEPGGGKDMKNQNIEDWLMDGTSRAATAGSNSVAANGIPKGLTPDEGLNADGIPIWITPQAGGSVETTSGPDATAQIEPRELCEFLLSECKARGVQIHLSTSATGLIQDETGEFKGLKLRSFKSDGPQIHTLECSKVVLAAGAWTPRLFKTLSPQSGTHVPISPLAGYSLVFRSPRYKTPFLNPAKRKLASGQDEQMCYGIFCPPGPHWSYAPEAFARLARHGDAELWIGGLNDSSLPLPDLATDAKKMIDPNHVHDLRRTTVQMTGLSKEGAELNYDDLETIREGLCFRPISRRGPPIVSPILEKHLGGVKLGRDTGFWMASGHGPWGITLSLGTGLVISEMIEGKKTSADISGLSFERS